MEKCPSLVLHRNAIMLQHDIIYGALFVNLLFNLFLEDFVMIYYLIYDNLAQWLNYHK